MTLNYLVKNVRDWLYDHEPVILPPAGDNREHGEYGSLRGSMAPSWGVWLPHGEYGSLRGSMAPSWGVWLPHGEYGSLRGSMAPSGGVWLPRARMLYPRGLYVGMALLCPLLCPTTFLTEPKTRSPPAMCPKQSPPLPCVTSSLVAGKLHPPLASLFQVRFPCCRMSPVGYSWLLVGHSWPALPSSLPEYGNSVFLSRSCVGQVFARLEMSEAGGLDGGFDASLPRASSPGNNEPKSQSSTQASYVTWHYPLYQQ